MIDERFLQLFRIAFGKKEATEEGPVRKKVILSTSKTTEHTRTAKQKTPDKGKKEKVTSHLKN